NPDRVLRLSLPSQPLLVMADPDRIGQVVTNYLANACKYSPPDTPIEIALLLHEAMARVNVRDHGLGLPKRECKRSCSRFYQVLPSRAPKKSAQGFGLGLYISRDLIRRHQGQVGVESTLGQGATFWFALPLMATTGLSRGGAA